MAPPFDEPAPLLNSILTELSFPLPVMVGVPLTVIFPIPTQ